jgi:hypothetical protein
MTQANAVQRDVVRGLFNEGAGDNRAHVEEQTNVRIFDTLADFKMSIARELLVAAEDEELDWGDEDRPSVVLIVAENEVPEQVFPRCIKMGPPADQHGVVIAVWDDALEWQAHGWHIPLLVMGPSQAASEVLDYLLVKDINTRVYPPAYRTMRATRKRDVRAAKTFDIIKPNAWKATDAQLHVLGQDQLVEKVDVVMSYALLYYPHLAVWLSTNCTVREIADYEFHTGRVLEPTTLELDPIKSDKTMIWAAMHLCGCAFSQEEMVGFQLWNRIKALSAAMNGKDPTKAVVEAERAIARFTAGVSNTWLDAMFGQLLAFGFDRANLFHADGTPDIDKPPSHDPYFKVSDLITRPEYDRWYGSDGEGLEPISDLAWSIMMQLRIVYADMHSSTVKFALGVRILAAPHVIHLQGPWRAELETLDQVAGEIAGRPFTGLVKQLPEHHQVASWPRFAVVGLDYHKRSLKDEKEKDTWDKYNVGGIRKKISPPQDLDICDAVVDLLPKQNVVAIAMMIETKSFQDSRKMLEGRDKVFTDAVYYFLRDRPNPGAWATEQRLKRTNVELDRIREFVKTMMTEILSETSARLLEEITDTVPAAERDYLKARLKNFLTMVRAQFNPVGDLVALIGPSMEEIDEGAKTTLVQKMAGLLDVGKFLTLEELRGDYAELVDPGFHPVAAPVAPVVVPPPQGPPAGQ